MATQHEPELNVCGLTLCSLEHLPTFRCSLRNYFAHCGRTFACFSPVSMKLCCRAQGCWFNAGQGNCILMNAKMQQRPQIQANTKKKASAGKLIWSLPQRHSCILAYENPSYDSLKLLKKKRIANLLELRAKKSDRLVFILYEVHYEQFKELPKKSM